MPLSWSLGLIVTCLLLLSPVIALAVLALNSTDNIWPHLISTVLPRATRTTIILMLGVGCLTLMTGAGTAWLVSMYNFPGRRIFTWGLAVPLAIPTYLAAFCYVELWDYSGPIQSSLRTVFGWKNATHYWFPDIHSLPGAIMVISFVLYPYVYMTARASFLAQSVTVLEASRALGRTSFATFWSIGLPLARPALVAGLTLTLMECLNDIGAVEYLGVNTLTLSVYSTWLQRSSLSGAAQISCVMLVFVLLLIAAERWSRRGQSFAQPRMSHSGCQRQELRGLGAGLAMTACLIPIILGFVLPALILLNASISHWREVLALEFWSLTANSLMLAASAASIAVLISLILAYMLRLSDSYSLAFLVRFSTIGYAIPGTVLAIGVLVITSGYDKLSIGVASMFFNVSHIAILTGTSATVIFAYVVRFLAISQGTLEAGFTKLPPHLDWVARSLGRSPFAVLREIHLPLIFPALGAAALLVFVDAMKELPATLLLRPFNFDTLATNIYTLASLDLFENAAPAALTIVIIGMLPVVLLNTMVANTGNIRSPKAPS